MGYDWLDGKDFRSRYSRFLRFFKDLFSTFRIFEFSVEHSGAMINSRNVLTILASPVLVMVHDCWRLTWVFKSTPLPKPPSEFNSFILTWANRLGISDFSLEFVWPWYFKYSQANVEIYDSKTSWGRMYGPYSMAYT